MHTVDDTLDVHVDDRVIVFGRDIFEPAMTTDACIVEQHVHSAFGCLAKPIDGCRPVRTLAHVERGDMAVFHADFVGDLGKAGGVDVIEAAIPTALGKVARRLGANAGGCAGYEYALASARSRHALSFMREVVISTLSVRRHRAPRQGLAPNG